MCTIEEKFYVSSFMFNIIIWFLNRLAIIFHIPHNLFQKLYPKIRCPPIENKLLLYSGTELAKQIRQGEIKCEDLIRAYVKRIEEVNPILNAIVEDRFNNALKEAIAVDELIKSNRYSITELEKTKPLLGLPITFKESIAVKGMTHNAGSLKVMFKRLRATEDAPLVKAVKDAGGIITAVTSTPELCFYWETTNKIIGTTCNPYDVRKSPGGSSGGEAALISAGASLIGFGSDTAGSIRIPAHFTGIFSHKPTPEIVPNKGHFPCSPDPRFSKYLIMGPLVRYFEDLPLVMRVIANNQQQAQGECYLIKDIGTPLYREINVYVGDIKIFYMLDDGNYLTLKVDRDNCLAIQNAVQYFQDNYKIEAVEAKVKLMKHTVKIVNFTLMDIKDMTKGFYEENEGPWKELFKLMTFRSQACLPTVIASLQIQTFQGGSLLKQKCKEVEQIVKKLQEEFRNMLGDNGVLLCPAMTRNAVYHDKFYPYILDTAYCTIWNVLEMPVTTCPIRMDFNGMPVGIQVVANSYNDHLTLAVGKELEKAFGGWKSPPFSQNTKTQKKLGVKECT